MSVARNEIVDLLNTYIANDENFLMKYSFGCWGYDCSPIELMKRAINNKLQIKSIDQIADYLCTIDCDTSIDDTNWRIQSTLLGYVTLCENDDTILC